MGMSTHVVGFVPPDDKWKAMKAVYDACAAAGVPVPREVDKFFDGVAPDPAGVEIELLVREWRDEYTSEGFELDVESIPPHVRTIRFFNSW